MPLQELRLDVLHRASAIGIMTAVPELALLVRGTIADDATAEQLERMLSRPPEWGAVGVSDGAGLSWRTLSLRELRGIATAMQALGLPERRPDVVAVPDTSDLQAQTEVVGTIGDRAFSFSVSQLCSGYRGGDARAFAELMAHVLRLAAPVDPASARTLCAWR